MINKDFQGRITKYSPFTTKDGNCLVKVSIKHEEFGEVQNFLHPLQHELNVHNIESLYVTPISWVSHKIDCLSAYGTQLQLNFDAVSFDVTLVSVEVKRKYSTKKGEYFEYVINLTKEMDENDMANIIEYLNRKEEDENGKKQFLTFNTEIAVK